MRLNLLKLLEQIFFMQLKEKYVTDNEGNKIAVLLEIEEYQKLLNALEELESALLN